MKTITMYKDKLKMDIPDNLECVYDDLGVLILFDKKSRPFAIKILIVNQFDGDEQRTLFETIIKKGIQNRISTEKYYNIYAYSFKDEDTTLYVVAFEIIYKNYYINIRVNTLEKQEGELRKGLEMYISEIILTIEENNG